MIEAAIYKTDLAIFFSHTIGGSPMYKCDLVVRSQIFQFQLNLTIKPPGYALVYIRTKICF